MANINKNIIMQAGAAVANATNKAAGLSAVTPEPGSIISVIQLVNGGRTIGPDSLAHFTESVRNKLLSLLVSMEPIQSGTGDPSPDNVRPISGRTGLSVYDDPKYGGTVAWNQLAKLQVSYWSMYNINMVIDGTTFKTSVTSSASGPKLARIGTISGHVYFASAIAKWGTSSAYVAFKTSNNSTLKQVAYADSEGSEVNGAVVYKVSDDNYFTIGATFNAAESGTYQEFDNVMLIDLTQMFGSTIADHIYSLEQANAGAGVAWFRNLFPKDYYPYNAGEQTCVSAVNGDPYWKKDIDWTTPAGTVYAGSADIVSGDIKAAPYYASYNGETLVGPWVSSMDVYDPEGTPTTGAQVVDLGGTMTEYHITGQDIITMLGDNCIWSDSGDVTITE